MQLWEWVLSVGAAALGLGLWVLHRTLALRV
jgi:phosphate/sulfate permease